MKKQNKKQVKNNKLHKDIIQLIDELVEEDFREFGHVSSDGFSDILFDRLDEDEIEYIAQGNLSNTDITNTILKAVNKIKNNFDKTPNTKNIVKEIKEYAKDFYKNIIEDREWANKQETEQKKKAMGQALLADSLNKQQKADLKKYYGITI
jgi:hypothetical protein